MPTAVISDIHGNAVALRAVLGDIASRGISSIVCLGDIVGYGPDPLECVDLVRAKCHWSLMGNHDYGVLYEPTNFNPGAESAAFWTRDQFDKESDSTLRAQRYEFLNRLRVRVVENIGADGIEFGSASANGTTYSALESEARNAGMAPTPARNGHIPLLAVHGSPRRPINEYIFPDDAMNSPDKMEAVFDRVQRLAIVGHTHVPGVFTDEPDFYPPGELGERGYTFSEGEKAIINVGSVGQPRDYDPRASYVVLHGTRAEFVRVPYDIDATAKKIKAIPQLSDWLGDRLYEGR